MARTPAKPSSIGELRRGERRRRERLRKQEIEERPAGGASAGLPSPYGIGALLGCPAALGADRTWKNPATGTYNPVFDALVEEFGGTFGTRLNGSDIVGLVLPEAENWAGIWAFHFEAEAWVTFPSAVDVVWASELQLGGGNHWDPDTPGYDSYFGMVDKEPHRFSQDPAIIVPATEHQIRISYGGVIWADGLGGDFFTPRVRIRGYNTAAPGTNVNPSSVKSLSGWSGDLLPQLAAGLLAGRRDPEHA